MAKKVTELRELKSRSWGGSRIPKGTKRAPRNTVIENIAEPAGNWMPFGKTEIEIEEDLVFFCFYNISDDGYLMEEILSPEDMFPSMYMRTKK